MRQRQRGDTMVEVILAFAIFAALAVGTTVIMNRGLAMGQQSLERTLVRQQVDAQAELLRYARDTNAASWGQITSNTIPTPVTASLDSCPASAPSRSFVMSMTGVSLGVPTVNRVGLDSGVYYATAGYHSRVVLDTTAWGSAPIAQGMWIQAVRVDGPASAGQAYDMYIRACWDSTGTSVPMQVSTIVRLYEN